MQGLSYVDVDYCRFENLGYQKPTRFYGGQQVKQLENVLCDKYNCPALIWDRVPTPGRPVRHCNHMGGGTGRVITEQACYIPPGVLQYVAGIAPAPPPWPSILPEPRARAESGTRENPAEEDERLVSLLMDPKMAKAVEEVRAMRISATPQTSVIAGDPVPLDDDEVDFDIASRFLEEEAKIFGVKTGIESLETIQSKLADELRQALVEEFQDSSLSGVYPGTKVRGPDGEAEIWLQPGAILSAVPLTPSMTKSAARHSQDWWHNAKNKARWSQGRVHGTLHVFLCPKKHLGHIAWSKTCVHPMLSPSRTGIHSQKLWKWSKDKHKTWSGPHWIWWMASTRCQ